MKLLFGFLLPLALRSGSVMNSMGGSQGGGDKAADIATDLGERSHGSQQWFLSSFPPSPSSPLPFPQV